MKKSGMDDVQSAGRFQKFGLILAAVFFVVSVIMVIHNHGGMSVMFSPDTQVLTFAHWQLEDGFREGFEEAIAEYECRKAEQGVKVKVNQVAVPVRGYPQWYLTQLIGGSPADVMELSGSSDIINQYFTPLSPYIGNKNPWNKGTPLEDYSWRESFIDDMLSALDAAYSEFFSVCLFMHTTRVYVNMDLYREATGTDVLPDTFTEWIEACKKLRDYGKTQSRPVIPIGVRGFDKGTIGQLFNTYFAELNTDLLETGSRYGYGMATGEIYHQVNTGQLAKDKLLEPVEVVTEIGQYFADGFPAIDLEQTKYLFSSGNVGFFIDGTYNAWSMVQNAPFEVAIIKIPVLDDAHPIGQKGFGRIAELGSGVQGKFGIPKRTKNFDLALDFLQFITSWEVNQRTMVDYCKWMSSLKHVEYEGLMKTFEPVSSTSHSSIPSPFTTSLGAQSNRLGLQRLETSILTNPDDPKKFFWNDFVKVRYKTIDEINEANLGAKRTLWFMDGTRSALAMGADVETDPRKKYLYQLRSNINLEGIVSRIKAIDNYDLLMEELAKLEEYE